MLRLGIGNEMERQNAAPPKPDRKALQAMAKIALKTGFHVLSNDYFNARTGELETVSVHVRVWRKRGGVWGKNEGWTWDYWVPGQSDSQTGPDGFDSLRFSTHDAALDHAAYTQACHVDRMERDARKHPTVTIEDMESAARDFHRANYADSGDSYATAEELEVLLSDPLAFYEMVRDQITLRLGAILRSHSRAPELADDLELERAAERHAASVAYVRERAERNAEPVAAPRIVIRSERDRTIYRAFQGERCLASALLRRPYSDGPLWTISYSDGSHHGTADSQAEMRRELRAAALARWTDLVALERSADSMMDAAEPVAEPDARPAIITLPCGCFFAGRTFHENPACSEHWVEPDAEPVAAPERDIELSVAQSWVLSLLPSDLREDARTVLQCVASRLHDATIELESALVTEALHYCAERCDSAMRACNAAQTLESRLVAATDHKLWSRLHYAFATYDA